MKHCHRNIASVICVSAGVSVTVLSHLSLPLSVAFQMYVKYERTSQVRDCERIAFILNEAHSVLSTTCSQSRSAWWRYAGDGWGFREHSLTRTIHLFSSGNKGAQVAVAVYVNWKKNCNGQIACAHHTDLLLLAFMPGLLAWSEQTHYITYHNLPDASARACVCVFTCACVAMCVCCPAKPFAVAVEKGPEVTKRDEQTGQ